jgi:predicted metalloprotease
MSVGRGLRVGGGLGAGGALVLLLLSLLTGRDFTGLMPQESPGTVGAENAPVASTPEEERMVDFVSFVLDSSQATWNRILPREAGVQYRDAKLVLFRDAVESACGFAEAAMGPFYCPMDERVFIDLGFFNELGSRFGAPGDFAQAYVLAHEVGHHVQNVLGVHQQVANVQQSNPAAKNELSVRVELQADCFAGIWGHHTRQLLDAGDVEEGLGAAAAVGDDRLQRQATGRVSPESFTHGSSQQRATWFRRGLTSGRVSDCDTFK